LPSKSRSGGVPKRDRLPSQMTMVKIWFETAGRG